MLLVFGSTQTDLSLRGKLNPNLVFLVWGLLLKATDSMEAINDRAFMLTKLSQELAKEAIMTGVEISLCGRISDYKTEIALIRERMLKKIYPNRFIPTGRTESQPNVSGLGFITEGDRQLQARKRSLESRAAGVLKRFEGMKL